jgi:hypothetical protein
MSNKLYLNKAHKTIAQLRKAGKYKGDIVLLIGDDLKDEIANHPLENKNTIIKHFPDFDRSQFVEIYKKKPLGDGREINKVFQWHKMHCFDTYFKQWKQCFYIDAGMHIYKPVEALLKLDCTDKLLAHSDAHPTYEWKLKGQFDDLQFPELYHELYTRYNLEIDYFQSTVLLYDSNIIEENTKQNLLELSNKYIHSRTNEQAIFNVYFNCMLKIWTPLQIKDHKTYFYDYWERDKLTCRDYIMLKYPKTKKFFSR